MKKTKVDKLKTVRLDVKMSKALYARIVEAATQWGGSDKSLSKFVRRVLGKAAERELGGKG